MKFWCFKKKLCFSDESYELWHLMQAFEIYFLYFLKKLEKALDSEKFFL